jgi:hypothetical protein
MCTAVNLRHLCLLLCLALPQLRAAEPAEAGPEILSLTGAVTWAPLFSRLAAKGPIYSLFTEQRHFSYKKTPVVLQGELRFSPDLGLSLRYTTPEDRMMILDNQGLVLRDGKGRQKTPSGDARIPDMVRSLLAVMQFDAESMLNQFILRGARDGDDWRIDLEPRSKEQARLFGWITVYGNGDDVRHLVFRRSTNQRVEILIRQTRAVQGFGAEERKRFFR